MPNSEKKMDYIVVSGVEHEAHCMELANLAKKLERLTRLITFVHWDIESLELAQSVACAEDCKRDLDAHVTDAASMAQACAADLAEIMHAQMRLDNQLKMC